jgi:hypothetical protein
VAVILRRPPSVLDAIRETIVGEVHFAEVKPSPGRPTVLRIEGPGALSGAAERAVVGHEQALKRAGFRVVECLGVDPDDTRGRQGRLRALVPSVGTEWRWERMSGAELQARIMEGDEGRLEPRATQPERVATVLALGPRRRK